MPGILIVDDHYSARIAIRELLDWHSFQICGDAKDGKEAVDKVIEMKPEIVLMDINMPVMNGVAAAQEIRRIAPQTKIVFLTVHDTPAARLGTRLWAHGFVSKSEAGTELIPTLQRITGRTPDEVIVVCSHCKVRQTIHLARRSKVARAENQYVTCMNCSTEFEVKVRSKIVAGPFHA